MVKVFEFGAVDFGVPLEFDVLDFGEFGAADAKRDDTAWGIGGESGAVVGDDIGENDAGVGLVGVIGGAFLDEYFPFAFVAEIVTEIKVVTVSTE